LGKEKLFAVECCNEGVDRAAVDELGAKFFYKELSDDEFLM